MAQHWHVYTSHTQQHSGAYPSLAQATREYLRVSARMVTDGWTAEKVSHDARYDMTVAFQQAQHPTTSVIARAPCIDTGCADR